MLIVIKIPIHDLNRRLFTESELHGEYMTHFHYKYTSLQEWQDYLTYEEAEMFLEKHGYELKSETVTEDDILVAIFRKQRGKGGV